MGSYILDVPYKSNGKSAQFFDDRLEFKGNSIRYDEIEILTATRGNTTINTYVGIPLGRSFQGGVQFKMNNGKTCQINMNSVSLFGIPFIGNPRKNEKLCPPIFDAVYSIVAKSMAEKQIDLIRGGATVEIAGMLINSLEAKPKKSKDDVVINKENYRDCQLTNDSGVAVFNNIGDKLWRSSIWSNKSVLLLPYIFDAIYGI